jgi:hypothetical protein
MAHRKRRRTANAPDYKHPPVRTEWREHDNCRVRLILGFLDLDGDIRFIISTFAEQRVGEDWEPVSTSHPIYKLVPRIFPEYAHLYKWQTCGIKGPLNYKANAVLWHGFATDPGARPPGFNTKGCLDAFAFLTVLGSVPGEETRVEVRDQDLVVWLDKQEFILSGDKSEHIAYRTPDSEQTLLTWLDERLEHLLVQFKAEVTAAGVTFPE